MAERLPKVMRRSERRNNLQICQRQDSNTGGSDLWFSMLPLDHGGAPYISCQSPKQRSHLELCIWTQVWPLLLLQACYRSVLSSGLFACTSCSSCRLHISAWHFILATIPWSIFYTFLCNLFYQFAQVSQNNSTHNLVDGHGDTPSQPQCSAY